MQVISIQRECHGRDNRRNSQRANEDRTYTHFNISKQYGDRAQTRDRLSLIVGGATMSAHVLGAWRSRMPNARAPNVECLLRYFRKFLRLRRRQVKNNAVSFQANLLGRQFYPMLAYAQVAADIGIHRGNLVVGGTMKGCDLP